MPSRWQVRAHDAARVAELERAAGIPAVVAQLLAGRGVHEPAAARRFLDAKLTDLHEPDLLPGVPEAADRLFAAVRASRRIIVYGDYDVDGMTGAAILFRCLKLLGGDVGCFTPNRLDEGYGLHDDSLAALAERGASLVVTVDCGASAAAQAETARRLGLELIITDHHEFGEQLPAADVLVHPRRPDGNYPFPWLSGAGVAFKLAWAVCQRASGARRVSEALKEFLLSAVGLAALGTVADVVPLSDENRVLVRHGLTALHSRPPLGLAALMKLTGLSGKSELTSEDLGFMLSPRLNAAGRLGQAPLGVELLTTESPERAQALAEYLHQINATRESLERSIQLAAAKQLKEQHDPERDAALVLAGAGWHPGVIGIVAARLAERHHRPVVLIALDEAGVKPGVGSARSACGLPLHEALHACREHLLTCGGHAAAAGLKIEPARIDAFREDFLAYAAGAISRERFEAVLDIDAEAPLAQLSLAAVRQIEQLAPFGAGNPRPVLCAADVRLAEPPRRIGGGERHLSASFVQHGVKLRGVAFGQGERADELAQHAGPLEIAFRPVINEFRGRRSVELHLVDWRTSGEGK